MNNTTLFDAAAEIAANTLAGRIRDRSGGEPPEPTDDRRLDYVVYRTREILEYQLGGSPVAHDWSHAKIRKEAKTIVNATRAKLMSIPVTMLESFVAGNTRPPLPNVMREEAESEGQE